MLWFLLTEQCKIKGIGIKDNKLLSLYIIKSLINTWWVSFLDWNLRVTFALKGNLWHEKQRTTSSFFMSMVMRAISI